MKRKGFSKLDNPSHEGATNTWLTPLSLIQQLGIFDLDPCAFPNHNTAIKMICLPEDGLNSNWIGRVWLNPPYGLNISKWLKKLESHKNGIALVFSRTDTNWFQDIKPDAIFCLKGRIKFLKEDKTCDSNAGHGSILIIFGQNNLQAVQNSGLQGKLYIPHKCLEE
jgi:DNA N-6-adenine-methyltransferase (Dam)